MKGLPQLDKKPSSTPEQTEGHVEALSEIFQKWRDEGLFEPRPIASSMYGAVIVAMIIGSVYKEK